MTPEKALFVAEISQLEAAEKHLDFLKSVAKLDPAQEADVLRNRRQALADAIQVFTDDLDARDADLKSGGAPKSKKRGG